MEAGVPTDPTSGRANGCQRAGQYGYGAGTSSGSSPQFVITSTFENVNGGNYNGVIATGGLFETGGFSANARAMLDLVGSVHNVAKGAGSGYVIYK